ncbi:RNA-directed DNA polymerase, eukaryota [Tanacetum coccineum]
MLPENPSFSPLYLCSAPIQYANYTNPDSDYKVTGEASLKLKLINQKSSFSFALFTGGLSTAAFDVFTVEPTPKDNILVIHEKVIVHLISVLEGVAIEIAEAVGGALKARARCYCIEAHIYAEENGLFFMETSVKTVVNVNEVFHEIVPETIVLSETAKIMPRAQLTQNPVGMVLVDRPAEGAHAASCSSSPAMVLDDECVVERDLDNFVMGEVKDFSSINNLRVLLSNEGFQHVRLAYLGGLWVMIELTSVQTKMRFMKHVGVASWFSQLCKAQPDFVSRERIVWIDIEGVPLHAWSRPTFSKIGSRWGEVIELEDNKEDCFARKRICIKTKLEDNILEKFKIIVRGKFFVIRAKELFVWSPTFNDNKEVDDYSEDDSVNGAEEINGDISKQMNLDDETDIEGVSDTVFDDKADSLGHEHTQNLSPNEKENSSDPFNLYNLLNKRDKGEANSGLDLLSYMPVKMRY